MLNSRLSLRKAASSVRSSVVSPVLPLVRSARACSTQLRSDDSVNPKSRAAAATVLPSSRTRRGGSSGCRATGRSTKYSHQRASCLDDGGCRVCDGAVHGPHAPYLGRRHLRSSDLGASRTCHPHHPGSARGNGLSRKPCSSRATRPPRTAGSFSRSGRRRGSLPCPGGARESAPRILAPGAAPLHPLRSGGPARENRPLKNPREERTRGSFLLNLRVNTVQFRQGAVCVLRAAIHSLVLALSFQVAAARALPVICGLSRPTVRLVRVAPLGSGRSRARFGPTQESRQNSSLACGVWHSR